MSKERSRARRGDSHHSRLKRNPDLLICWREGRLQVRDLAHRTDVRAPASLIPLLDRFGRPRTLESVAAEFPDQRALARRSIQRLVSLGLLVPAEEVQWRDSRLRAWRYNLASAHYHLAARDQRYLESPEATDVFLRTEVMRGRRPPRFKRYATRRRVALPAVAGAAQAELGEVLERRRTVRRFASEPTSLSDLAAVVRGTWGRTGWLDGGPLGRLATKTSPSAGALHPIECYLLVWNVRGMSSGLYHYDVPGDELRRLRSGRFAAAAVKAASGQWWVGSAAFLCVMTAVFARTLWKYRLENAYRSLWLDAGHLAQTFCLLAVARGLGAFTTAAMQDSFIESFLGLDGASEFPVYLCGAGRPASGAL